MTDADEQGEADGEQAEATENGESESTPEAAPEGGDQPAIDPDEQAAVPDGLADVDPEEIEDTAGAGAGDDDPDDDQEDDADEPDAMAPDVDPASPAKAGELYVSVVQSVTNANIKKFGGEDAGEVDREHFEQYDLAAHFNATMDQMGVGSDMEPHEALLMATVLSVGDGLATETDAMDRLIGQLMDSAMGVA